MPGAVAVLGASELARRGSGLRWLCAAALSVPVLLPVLLVVLLDAGVRADASTAEPMAGLRAAAVPEDWAPLLQSAGTRCAGVTAPLLAAQIEAESGWNPRAVSPAGAQGLAQFMPATWASEGEDGNGDGRRDVLDPADSIASQAGLLCRLLTAVTGDHRLTGDRLDLTLAAYNAGLGAVRRAGGVPPYAETQQYVRRIRALTARYAQAPASGGAATSSAGSDRGPWAWPASGAVSSGFGPRGGRLHAGIDLAIPIGTPVLAAHAGTVVAAGPATGFGFWVKLAHPGGVSTVYGHLSSWSVHVGQPVTAGQRIALSGNTGRSSGPHLHFEVLLNGRPVDPVTFYAARAVARP